MSCTNVVSVTNGISSLPFPGKEVKADKAYQEPPSSQSPTAFKCCYQWNIHSPHPLTMKGQVESNQVY